MSTHHVLIQGVRDPIVFPVSPVELAFIALMIRERRSDYYFAIGPYVVQVSDKLRQVYFEEDLW